MLTIISVIVLMCFLFARTDPNRGTLNAGTSHRDEWMAAKPLPKKVYQETSSWLESATKPEDYSEYADTPAVTRKRRKQVKQMLDKSNRAHLSLSKSGKDAEAANEGGQSLNAEIWEGKVKKKTVVPEKKVVTPQKFNSLKEAAEFIKAKNGL